MKFIPAGFVLMVAILASKLFLAFYIDDVNHYNLHADREKKSEAQLTRIGESLYTIHCTSCHGKNGDGNNGKAQNHTYRIAEKSVLYVIENGSNNFRSVYPSGMPAGLVEGSDAKEIARFVSKGLKGNKPKRWSVCASCHDESGEGIAFVAPDLKTYSDTLVATVLSNGKKGAIGTMPVFRERLSKIQMSGLAHYIRSLQR
ncbi:c-type cytochrome [Sulfurimonas diazotrophicus]|uniref:C-type cytochrome n=1 Tax=Sulfurimonas diazotrophicus TaxID=3131939 RepID=A0ABZ3H7Q8_9BACT